MNTIPETTLERVRKLLAKAEGTDNEHERELFMAAACSLMAKYGIEQAHLGARKTGNRPTDVIVCVGGEAWAGRRINLISGVASAMGCRAITVRAPRQSNSPTSSPTVHLFGFESDLKRAEMMYTSLLLQMATGLNRLGVPGDENGRAYPNSWMHGFIFGAVELLAERERRAATPEEAGVGTEIVLRDRSLAVTAAMASIYPNVRKTYARSSGTGYSDGRAAGAQANLGGVGLAGGHLLLT